MDYNAPKLHLKVSSVLKDEQISTQGGLSAEIDEIPLIFLLKLLSFKKSYLNKFKPQSEKLGKI